MGSGLCPTGIVDCGDIPDRHFVLPRGDLHSPAGCRISGTLGEHYPEAIYVHNARQPLVTDYPWGCRNIHLWIAASHDSLGKGRLRIYWLRDRFLGWARVLVVGVSPGIN